MSDAGLSTADRAKGRWRGLLPEFGIPAKVLDGKHHPCPMCGGTDRYRFIDTDGHGTYVCNQCGGGSGMTLVMRFRGWDFRTAAMEVDRIVGRVPIRPAKETRPPREALKRLWMSSRPVVEGDAVTRYLAARGIPDVPMTLRNVVQLRNHETRTWHPGMIAIVHAPDGKPCTIHRTYLGDGRKADLDEPRKLMPGPVTKGSAVRLMPHGDVLGIAEGIETALSAARLFAIPCWAALTEGLLRDWVPPVGIDRIVVFGDNDRNFVGQSSAFALARRISMSRDSPIVEVKIPEQPGFDWNDVLQRVS